MPKNIIELCIIDSDKERCLREEEALEKAIALRQVRALAICNYGECFAARNGISTEQMPVIEIGDAFFMPKHPGEELTVEKLCVFLDLIAQKGLLRYT